jgi:hypothetical protein
LWFRPRAAAVAAAEGHVNDVRNWMRWGVWLLAVGGGLWVLKVVFIALNDVVDRNVDSFPVPVFYLGAILLMVLGSMAVGIVAVRKYAWWAQLLGALAGLIGLFLLYSVLDAVLKAAFGDAGPWWLKDELGIFATGAVCFVAGLLLARRIAGQQRPHPASSAF